MGLAQTDRDKPENTKLVVQWLDPERQLPVGFEIMKSEVAQLLGSTRVEILWERHSSKRSQRRPGELFVVLRSEQPSEWRIGYPALGDRIMGAVAPGSPVIFICVSNIARILGYASPAVRASAPMNGTFGLARALGRVVTHELIHTLLPNHPHTSEGFMKARWVRSYLRRPEVRLDEGCVRALNTFLF
jgi:hypothetical protein